MFSLTLVYENETTWFVGAFQTMDLLEKWLNEEKTRPYWKSNTQTQVQEI